MQYDGKQIMTAKSQIQVHNRFFLKETSKLSQTVEFLATMTKVITASHLHTDLHVIPTRYLSRSSYSTLQENLKATRPGQAFLTSFEAYQDLNDKNASRTLKVAFGRMLLCVKGMSAERVSAMLDIWETPRSLWDDLKARVEQDKASKLDDDDEEMDDGKTNKGKGKGKGKGKIRGPELFFADRVQGEGRRKIGDALSREVSACVQRGWQWVNGGADISCIGFSWATLKVEASFGDSERVGSDSLDSACCSATIAFIVFWCEWGVLYFLGTTATSSSRHRV